MYYNQKLAFKQRINWIFENKIIQILNENLKLKIQTKRKSNCQNKKLF